jgi:hypothetical protein
MKNLNALLTQIESARQKLEHVTRAGDTARTYGMLRALNALYEELYSETLVRESLKAAGHEPDDLKLVFTDDAPDGMLMSQSEYRAWLRANRRSYSYAVDVGPEMVQMLLTGS